jgi:hypothetical protein
LALRDEAPVMQRKIECGEIIVGVTLLVMFAIILGSFASL